MESAIRDALAPLLDVDRDVRRRAASTVELDSAGNHALRAVLFLDQDATVRQQAALRLGRGARALVVPWLVQALDDRRPMVRDAACQALARVRGGLHALGRVALEDPVWWVRRSAVRGMVAAGPHDATLVSMLRAVLEDPFWRVRHAATQALALMGDAVPELQSTILQGDGLEPATSARAALQFLEARWGGGHDVAVGQSEESTSSYDPLDDPDPAVVAAHLATLDTPALDPRRLVSLLQSSHEPLRKSATRRLGEALRVGDNLPVLKAVRTLLDDLRVPHGHTVASALLDDMGPRARTVVESTFADEHVGPGALAWACRWVAAQRATDLYPALQRQLRHSHPRVRRDAVTAWADIAGTERSTAACCLVRSLDDSHFGVREAAVRGLASVDEPNAREALAGVSLSRQSAPLRCLLMTVAGRDADRERLLLGAVDETAEVRAVALGQLNHLGWLSTQMQRSALAADDPWVRRAALDGDAALDALQHDVDPWVRREALTLLGRNRDLDDAARRDVVALAAGSVDPWLRARGCELLRLNDDHDLRIALLLSHDTTPMVRAAAASFLETAGDLDHRLRKLLQRGDATERQRIAAYTYLLRHHDDTARTELERALADPHQPELVVEHLQAMRSLFEPAEETPEVTAPLAAARRVARVEQRVLGRSELSVAPLVVSGAFQLRPGALATAAETGVNLFFWEPRYTNLTRFLRGERQRELRVVTGTFNADRAGVTHDLELALRRLGRERIDVFLLFWARSPARLSRDLFELLQREKQRGRIGACGFSTHHRALACQALEERDWDVVMVRHSAAHPGAEDELFPLAERRGVGVLTFSALCYGRMLKSAAGDPPTAADCYRYSLSQPAVAACISAPRRFRELQQNLVVLADPTLDVAEAARLRDHGADVHRENRRFDRLIRRGDLHEAALGWLEHQPPVAASQIGLGQRDKPY